MVTLERNPTHIETAPPEGDVRFNGVSQKKNRKNSGADGIFGKLLAGLASKKNLKQPETQNNSEIILKNDSTGEDIKNSKKNAGFLHLPAGKENNSLNENGELLLFNAEDAKTEAARNQQRNQGRNQSALELESLAAAFTRLFPEVESPYGDIVNPETVSFKIDNPEQANAEMEQRLPFNKEEIPETLEADIRNAALNARQSLQSNSEENTALASERSGKNQNDVRRSQRKRDIPLEVHDLRTSSGTETTNISERGLKSAQQLKDGPVQEITVELRPTGDHGEKPAEAGQNMTLTERFDQMLARELRGELSADIVRQAVVILRDGGEGTIRLSLKPETLGKVKIHLEMAENRILGSIIVESKEALQAFEQEIQSLEQSFRDSGYEASLNASLDYKNDHQQWKENVISPFFSERFAASYDDSAAMEVSGFYSGFETPIVNVLI